MQANARNVKVIRFFFRNRTAASVISITERCQFRSMQAHPRYGMAIEKTLLYGEKSPEPEARTSASLG